MLFRSRDGTYTLEIQDVANGGGPEYFFVLRLHNKDNPPDVHWESAQSLNWINEWIDSSVRAQLGEQRSEEDRPNDHSAVAETIKVPSTTSGSFDRPGDVDWFQFSVEANRKLVIATKSREIGEPCDPRISVWDASGKMLAESAGSGSEAASLTNTFPAAGVYRVRVDEVSRLGGMIPLSDEETYGYSLSISDLKRGVVLTTEMERTDFSKDGEAKIKIACILFIRLSLSPHKKHR